MIDINEKCWGWYHNSVYNIGTQHRLPQYLNKLDKCLYWFYKMAPKGDEFTEVHSNDFRIIYVYKHIVIHKFTIKEAQRILKLTQV